MGCLFVLLRVIAAFIVLTVLYFANTALRRNFKTRRISRVMVVVLIAFLCALSICGLIYKTDQALSYAAVGFISSALLALLNSLYNRYIVRRGGKPILYRELYTGSVEDYFEDRKKNIQSVFAAGGMGALLGLAILGGLALHDFFNWWSSIPLLVAGIAVFVILERSKPPKSE